jgi:hypothetical protein
LCCATDTARSGHTARQSRYFSCQPVGRQNFVLYSAVLFENLLTGRKGILFANTWPLFWIGLLFLVSINWSYGSVRLPEYLEIEIMFLSAGLVSQWQWKHSLD